MGDPWYSYGLHAEMFAVFWYRVDMELDRMQVGLELILQIDNEDTGTGTQY